MTYEYVGPERRSVDHCDMHAQNSQTLQTCSVEISAIKSSMFTARWIIGLLIGVGVLIIGSTLTEIKATITEIRQDVKMILPIEARIERLEKTVDYNSERINKLEDSNHEHPR